MTDLAELEGLFSRQDADPVPTPRKCRRHEWQSIVIQHDLSSLEGPDIYTPPFCVCGNWWPCPDAPQSNEIRCVRCGAIRDETRARRGKSARRLGGDQERRIERIYGPVKIGERGDPVDHIGRVWRWQSKATRKVPPLWLAAIVQPTYRLWTAIPKTSRTAWLKMQGLYGPRSSVLIWSFVTNGVRTRDWLFVSLRAGSDEFNLVPPEYALGWWVIPGDWWLDHFGKDEMGNTRLRARLARRRQSHVRQRLPMTSRKRPGTQRGMGLVG
jgi:hypothetical protein